MPFSTQVVMDGRKNMEQDEAPCAADVMVGDLLQFDANANVVPQATDGEYVERAIVALDARGRGYELGDSYDGASGENTPYAICAPGVRLHMRLAAGATVVKDQTPLVPAGGGVLRPIDVDGTAPDDSTTDTIAVPAESVDNSGGTEPAYCGIEITR